MKIVLETINGNDTVYMDCLKTICGETNGKSMIDLCCNLAPHTPLLGFKERIYVDILPRKLDHDWEQVNFIQDDIFNVLGKDNNTTNVSICSDGIEHLTKEDGLFLIMSMMIHSRRQVIFTPLGNHMVEEGNDPENHHSGWLPEEFEGWASITFPKYHPTLGIGAFFAWHCENMEEDFERVKNELKQKSWAINLQVH